MSVHCGISTAEHEVWERGRKQVCGSSAEYDVVSAAAAAAAAHGALLVEVCSAGSSLQEEDFASLI